MPSNHLVLCLPLLLLPSVILSLRVFSSKLALHIRWPTYRSFSLSVSPSNEYSRSISFRIDWFNLLAVLGTLKSLLQHHNLKVSILRYSAFFMVQLSIHTGYWKNHSFDYMDLCLQSDVSTFQYSIFVIAFLPRSKHLLISWLQSLSAENKEIKSVTASTFCPSICHWVDGTRCHDLSFLNVEF